MVGAFVNKTSYEFNNLKIEVKKGVSFLYFNDFLVTTSALFASAKKHDRKSSYFSYDSFLIVQLPLYYPHSQKESRLYISAFLVDLAKYRNAFIYYVELHGYFLDNDGSVTL